MCYRIITVSIVSSGRGEAHSMRALVQRVSGASVSIDGAVYSAIQQGMLILLGVHQSDTEKAAEYLALRCAQLRMFEDEQAKMNLSLKDIGGEALVVSQFTLYADTRKGNRPSFTDAAGPETAEKLYLQFIECLKNELGPQRVASGVFRAMMSVQLVNDGPVTLIIDSKNS